VTRARTSRSAALMGTIVTIDVVAAGADDAITRAFNWFRHIEQCCSRFNPDSELRQLAHRVGVPVKVTPILYQAVQFALAVAEETGGLFDPTVGQLMEAYGFDREYTTGRSTRSATTAREHVCFRDVRLDPVAQTITLTQPMVLDLGAVAKGMAADAAARELSAFTNFAIDAGGDLYLAGHNGEDLPWTIGIPHPRRPGQLIETIGVTDRAVCTSGDYERRMPDGHDGHHILDPVTRRSATASSSATVVAPTAMLADALATAAFVLGPEAGVQLLERMDVEGVVYSPALERRATKGFGRAA
jgi:FAD:protein FMN transferase